MTWRIVILENVDWDCENLIGVEYYGPTKPRAGAASVVTKELWDTRQGRSMVIRQLRLKEQYLRRKQSIKDSK